MKKPTVATLFAGGGGDSLGFTSSGFELSPELNLSGDLAGSKRDQRQSIGNKLIPYENTIDPNQKFREWLSSGEFASSPWDIEHSGMRRPYDKLSVEEKNKYHKENMVAAGLVLIDIDEMPQTHEELKEWVVNKSKTKNYLIYTDVAKDVQEIIAGGPVPRHIKPIWPFISFTAFNTLPKEFKELYGVNESKIKDVILKFNLNFLKFTRPFLPPFFRLIPPARWAKQRLKSKPNLLFKDKAKF